jgi:hypothetical protein
MLRHMTVGLAAVLLLGLSLSAGEPAGKKLQGTWARTVNDSMYEFKFTGDTIHYTSEGPLGKMVVEADYATTRDGKVVFARVRSLKEGSGPVKGDLFSFGFQVKGDALTISDWKGTGAVGLAGFLQGDYRKADGKKE